AALALRRFAGPVAGRGGGQRGGGAGPRTAALAVGLVGNRGPHVPGTAARHHLLPQLHTGRGGRDAGGAPTAPRLICRLTQPAACTRSATRTAASRRSPARPPRRSRRPSLRSHSTTRVHATGSPKRSGTTAASSLAPTRCTTTRRRRWRPWRLPLERRAVAR